MKTRFEKLLICLYFIPAAALAAGVLTIKTGSSPNMEDGDTPLVRAQKVNSNMLALANGTLTVTGIKGSNTNSLGNPVQVFSFINKSSGEPGVYGGGDQDLNFFSLQVNDTRPNTNWPIPRITLAFGNGTESWTWRFKTNSLEDVNGLTLLSHNNRGDIVFGPRTGGTLLVNSNAIVQCQGGLIVASNAQVGTAGKYMDIGLTSASQITFGDGVSDINDGGNGSIVNFDFPDASGRFADLRLNSGSIKWSATNSAPANTSNVLRWVTVNVGNTNYSLPLYK